MGYVIPIRRKPITPFGVKGYIRITKDGSHQRMGTFGSWYTISPVVYKLLLDQGYKEADQYEQV